MKIGDIVRINVDFPQGMTKPNVNGEVGEIIYKIDSYYIVETLLQETTRFWFKESELSLATVADKDRIIRDYMQIEQNQLTIFG